MVRVTDGRVPVGGTPLGPDRATSLPPRGDAGRRVGRALILLAVLAVAFNLRPGVVSLGPVLEEAREGLGLTPAAAGVLTALPVMVFAAAGVVTPWLERQLGLRALVSCALSAIAIGLAVRPWAGGEPGFMGWSLVALTGMAMLNVAMPTVVNVYFADRVGVVTSLYSTSLAIGITTSAVLTVPIASATGSWRVGLAVWSSAALVACFVWLGLGAGVPPAPTTHGPCSRITLWAVARTRLGWGMAVFFGLQSIQAFAGFGWFAQVYRDAGFSPSTAGLLLGVITATTIPMSLVMPILVVRLARPALLIVTLTALYPIGYLGLLVAPVSGAWVWAVLIGAANTVFPVALTLISLHARTESGTAALSGFTQSVGYLMAVVGPLGVGLLHGSTGEWVVPLLVLTGLALPQIAIGALIARPAFIEDAVPAPPVHSTS